MRCHAPKPVVSAVLLLLLVVAPISARANETKQGGGPFGGPLPLPRDEITFEQRKAIEQVTRQNIALLRQQGKLEKAAGVPVLFDWPVVPWNGHNAFGYHGISNFIDQNASFPGFLLDYNCGTRTYDLANGYNHRGTDIFSWPNPWKYMNENKIAVVAAAPGVIIFKDESRPDMSCGFNNLPWNAVYVRHADGTVAWYGHLKRDLVTSKPVGDSVVTGEYLGIMGSSGSSTGPHLHFELWEDETYTQLLDPWQGACNSLNPDSRWLMQRPYLDKGVNQLTVGAASPDAVPPCPTIESPNEQYDFVGAQTVYFAMYVRDLEAGQVTALEIRRPNGTIWNNWGHTGSQYFAASFWWWFWNLPATPEGNWTFRVTYDGQVYERQFNIGSSVAAGGIPASDSEGTPLRVDKLAGDQFQLSWGESCRAADSDFVIYEGDIGDYYSHAQTTCTTNGDAAWTVSTPEADRYWLIAPRTANREGSSGTDSNGTQRPQPRFLHELCLERAFDCP